MENPIKMDDFGVLFFLETPKWVNLWGDTPQQLPLMSIDVGEKQTGLAV